MSLANSDGDGEPEEQQFSKDGAGEGAGSGFELDMSQLAERIESVQDNSNLEQRLESLEQAWVLVFDADTEEEAVYSMEMTEEDGAHVVLAFEDEHEAQRYADHLEKEEEYDGAATVQALDVAALVITSREADFRVGVVFKGDFVKVAGESLSPFITSAREAPEPMSLSITIVPTNLFEGRTSAEFLDPDEDPIWVLVHDAGTSDAQYFSMTLNGTSSVVCFKDAASAERCSTALAGKGAEGTTARSMLLEELLDSIDCEDTEVCLVDEVVETLVEDNGDSDRVGPGIVAADASDEILGTYPPTDGMTQASETTASTTDVRAMLDRLFDVDAEGSDDGPPTAQ